MEKALVGVFSMITNLRVDLLKPWWRVLQCLFLWTLFSWLELEVADGSETERVESRKIKCYPSYISFL